MKGFGRFVCTLGIVVMLSHCSDGRGRFYRNDRMFLTGPDLSRSTANLSRYRVLKNTQIPLHTLLLNNVWVGVDSNYKPLPDVGMRFYDPKYDRDLYEYRSQFDLLVKGYATRGEVSPFHASDGVLQGVVQHDTTWSQDPACFCTFAAGVPLNATPWITRCFQVVESGLAGRRIRFHLLNTDQGQVLEVAFANAAGVENDAALLFQSKSQLEDRLKPKPPMKPNK